MQWLVGFYLLLWSISALAGEYVVQPRTSFHNQNWFPLPLADMKAATVDTALAELSRSGRFRFVEHPEAGVRTNGELQLEVSLIEAAETVKLTITFLPEQQTSIVTTASTSIHGKDWRGIYTGFESVGRRAAQEFIKELASKARRTEQNITAPQPDDNPLAVKTYNEAQQRKQKLEFAAAREKFEQVAAMSSPGAHKWALLAADELRYSLPIFEAKQWLIKMGSEPGNRVDLLPYMNNAERLLQQVIADNTDKPERVIEAQRLMDDLRISRGAYANVLNSQSLNLAHMLGVLSRSRYHMQGEWPSRQDLESMIREQRLGLSLASYQSTSERADFSVKVQPHGTLVSVKCDPYRCDVETGK